MEEPRHFPDGFIFRHFPRFWGSYFFCPKHSTGGTFLSASSCSLNKCDNGRASPFSRWLYFPALPPVLGFLFLLSETQHRRHLLLCPHPVALTNVIMEKPRHFPDGFIFRHFHPVLVHSSFVRPQQRRNLLLCPHPVALTIPCGI
jgi:hypothetical protein